MLERKEITRDWANEWFIYDNGNLIWKKHRGNVKAGSLAGEINEATVYKKVQVNRKLYFVHRIIYAMFNGSCPPYIDHIDGDKLNNRIENLRAVNNSQNQTNSRVSANNKCGVKNVYFSPDVQKYRVTVRVNGVKKSFGSYSKLEDAAAVADAVMRETQGEYYRSGANAY